MTRTKKSILLIALIVVAASVALSVVLATRPGVQRAARPARTLPTVQMIEARQKPLARSLDLLGTARALRAAKVAAEVAGNVVWVGARCEPGQKVAEGEELVRIDPGSYRIALAGAEAALAEASAALRLQGIDNTNEQEKLGQVRDEFDAAQKELDRKKQLSSSGTISHSELDRESQTFAQVKNRYLDQASRVESSRALLQKARAAHAVAGAERDRAALDLARATLRAPFTGEVSARYVDQGNRVAVGAQVFEVVDYDTLVVDVELSQRHLDLVRAGARVTVSDREGRIARPGVLRYLSPRADDASRLFAAKVHVDNAVAAPAGGDAHGVALHPFLPGQFVRVRLTRSEPEPSLVVPFAAVTHDRRGDYLFVLEGEGNATSARKAYVTLVWRQGDDAVVDGIAEGERVVVRGHEDLVDGVPVRVGRW